ncbi:hypothetical protein SK128_018688, partial [Halocaridina rubra]
GIAVQSRIGRPHPCPFCSKVFPFKSILRNHIRIHTGEKPYACRVCSRTFNHCSNYYKHERVCAMKLAENDSEIRTSIQGVAGGDNSWGNEYRTGHTYQLEPSSNNNKSTGVSNAPLVETSSFSHIE